MRFIFLLWFGSMATLGAISMLFTACWIGLKTYDLLWAMLT
jgi:hypothetical protein